MLSSRRRGKTPKDWFAATVSGGAMILVVQCGMGASCAEPRNLRKKRNARNCEPSVKVFLNGRYYFPRASDLYARAQLDNPVRRDVEVIGDVACVPRHRGEDAVAPERHADTAVHRHDLLPREEERGLHQVEFQAERRTELEGARHVGPVHEAVAHADAPAAMAE